MRWSGRELAASQRDTSTTFSSCPGNPPEAPFARVKARYTAAGMQHPAVTAGCCIPAAVYLAFTLAKGASGGFPGQDEKVVDVSRWLAANSRPDQRIFVWGDATSVYYLAQRAPGTRYLNC